MEYTPEEAFAEIFKWININDGTLPSRIALQTVMCDYIKLKSQQHQRNERREWSASEDEYE